MKKALGTLLTILLVFIMMTTLSAAAQEQNDSNPAGSKNNGKVIAEVNGLKIHTATFEKLMQGRADPQALLDQIIAYLLLAEEAKKKGASQGPEFEEQLEMMKEQQLANFFYNREVEDKAELTDKDIEKMIPASDKYKVNFQQILVNTKEDAADILKTLQKEPDFNKLAKVRSKAKNASKGGQIGYVIPNTGYFEGELSDEDEKKIFRLKDGEVSEPIKTRQGYAIFKAVSRKELTEQEMESRKNYLRYKFQKTKLDEVRDSLLDRLRSKAKIELNDKNIKKLEKSDKINEASLKLVVATVNGKEILLKEILPPQRPEYGYQMNSPYLKQPEFLKNIINEKVNSELFLEEAKRLKYDQNEEFKRTFELLKNGLVGQTYAMEYVKDVKVTDEELKEYFETNRERFKEMPERIRVRHVLVPDEEQAKEILAKIKAGGDFEKLAEEFSICPTAKNGGDLGYFSRGRMAPLFEEAAFKLKKGEVSDVVRTNFGFHIIKMEDHKQAGASSLSDVRYEVEQIVQFQKRDKKIQDLIAKLKSKASITTNQEALKKYQSSLPTPPMSLPMQDMQGGGMMQ
ncbi:MAG: peptidylprolyl isomerase [bacterium]